MSESVSVEFTRKKLPKTSDLEAAFAQNGVPFKFGPTFELTSYAGGVTGALGAAEIGLEYYLRDSRKAGRVVATFHGQSATVVELIRKLTAILAQLTDGLVRNSQGGSDLSWQEAFQEAGMSYPEESFPTRPFLPGQLHLSPADFHWRTWEDHPPVPSSPALFDEDVVIARLKEAGWPGDKFAGRPFVVESYGLQPSASPEEARLVWRAWELAYSLPTKMEDRLRSTNISEAISLDDAKRHLATQSDPGRMALLLYRAAGLDTLLDIVEKTSKLSILTDMRATVWPALSVDERRHARDRVRKACGRTANYPVPLAMLAAMIGHHGYIGEVLAKASQIQPSQYRSAFVDIVLGCASPREIVRETTWRRLHLHEPCHVRAWLATTGLDALDWVVDSVLATKDSVRAGQLVACFEECVGGEAGALVMGELLSRKSFKAGKVAEEWFASHPEYERRHWVRLGAIESKRKRSTPQRPAYAQ